MVGTVRALGEEFTGLLTRGFALWWRLLPWLAGFALVGWAGYYAAVLAGSEVARQWPWLVVGCLAVGVVVQLAATVAALRLAVVRAGAVVDGDPAATTPLRLLSTTVLPFLAIFAAFGMVDSYARDVVVVIGQRFSLFGGSEFLTALNPAASATAALTVAASVVGLFVLRRVLESVAERTGQTWLGLVAALVEAVFGLLLLLSAFRLVEQFWLWLDDRQVAGWWDAVVDTLTGWFTLPPVLADACQFVAESAWPVVWDLLSQPLAWLALTAVVAGSRLAADRPRDGRLGAAGRLGREALAGDFDDKYLPLWHAVRFLAGSGWPLLGGFVLAFIALDWAGDLVTDSVIVGLGPFTGAAAVQTLPFLGLVSQVLVLTAKFALLAVTAARAGQAPGAQPRQEGRGLQAAVVGAICIAVALSSLALDRHPTRVVSAEPGQPIQLLGMTATVTDPRAGSSLAESDDGGVTTDLAFVVVTVSLGQERDGAAVTAELQAGRRTYRPWEASSLRSRPGFTSRRDIAFEVDPADLSAGVVLRLTPTVAISNGSALGEVRLPELTPAGSVSYDATGSEQAP